MTRRTISVMLVCDTQHEHSIRLLTDGRVGYAYGLGYQSPAAGTVCAEAVQPGLDTFIAACNQPTDGEDSEPCSGEVRFTPQADDWMIGSTEVERVLDEWGSEVER
jgi:hypothetical protein